MYRGSGGKRVADWRKKRDPPFQPSKKGIRDEGNRVEWPAESTPCAMNKGTSSLRTRKAEQGRHRSAAHALHGGGDGREREACSNSLRRIKEGRSQRRR